LAAELYDAYGADSELARSEQRVFNVEFRGRLLFSGNLSRHLPNKGELTDLLKKSAALKDLASRPRVGAETEQ
jgi:hypothetical protein